MTEQARSEEHRGRLLPDVAVADHDVAWLDACIAEDALQFGAAAHLQAIVRELREGNAERSGNVPLLPARARLPGRIPARLPAGL